MLKSGYIEEVSLKHYKDIFRVILSHFPYTEKVTFVFIYKTAFTAERREHFYSKTLKRIPKNYSKIRRKNIYT